MSKRMVVGDAKLERVAGKKKMMSVIRLVRQVNHGSNDLIFGFNSGIGYFTFSATVNIIPFLVVR